MAWNWRDEALDIHWSLTSEERALLNNKTPYGRLGFAILLKYFQNEGRFPEQINDVPSVVLVYLANQLDTDRSDLEDYVLNSRMSQRDRKEILRFLGIRRSTIQDRRELREVLTPAPPHYRSLRLLGLGLAAWSHQPPSNWNALFAPLAVTLNLASFIKWPQG